jgi:hypothetical protein
MNGIDASIHPREKTTGKVGAGIGKSISFADGLKSSIQNGCNPMNSLINCLQRN